MNQINEDVIKAREVVAGYKFYNKKTIEKCVEYNPKTKCRYFKKINVDPEAAEFKKKFIKQAKKEKSINTKITKASKIKVQKVKVTPKKKEPKPREISDNYIKIVEYTKEGKSISEIADILKISHHNISWHLKNWNDNKSKKEIQEENNEILHWIKTKAKLNGVEYCYSAWIGRKNLKMKYNLTSVQIISRCENMIKQGLLEEIKEMHSRKHGRMYKIIEK